MDLDASFNWLLQHWYYFLILGLVILLIKWYDELKRFRSQFIHWCQTRQETIIPEEQKFNPSLLYKWLKKVKPYSDKTKKIGKVLTYSEQPIKSNPKGEEILVRVTILSKNLLSLAWWSKANFMFFKSDVILDDIRKTILVPSNCYWERNSEGTMTLISPNHQSLIEWTNEKMFKDLHETAIDGYASQMTSYSSVKPTWGHEERVMDKENEGKALGFGSFLRRKPKENKISEEKI